MCKNIINNKQKNEKRLQNEEIIKIWRAHFEVLLDNTHTTLIDNETMSKKNKN